MRQGEVFAVIRRRPTMVLSWVSTAGLAAAAVWLIFAVPDDAGFWYLFQGLLALWLITWFVWLCGANPRLVVAEDGVDVTNYLFRYWIPWGAVSRVETSDRTVLVLTDGRRMRPAVGEWSLQGRRHGNPVQREIGEQVARAREAAGKNPGSEVRRRLHVHPVPWLAAFAVLILLLWWVRS
ncbi:hypothetical protein CU254_25800 [Amycolatopsis sp. AA4]|uniref:PH domain-containing protein n=1 Tax=Actinomycetes TaxID=1760 RepID=UPI0001B545C3|nr:MULTISPECIES: PH domain-containing protein [Actinomycetes]ATY13464.1 hypothetical protein CU254_25800 [Amycolatopsis sp. AA4]